MHNIAEYELDAVTQPMEIFAQTDKIDPIDLADGGTTLAKNHQYNGALPPHGTQPSLPYSPLIDASVATDEPLTRPHIENVNAACLPSAADLQRVCLKRSGGMRCGVYQD